MKKSDVRESEEKKLVYEKPEVEVIEFDSNDVMVLSSAENDGIYGL